VPPEPLPPGAPHPPLACVPGAIPASERDAHFALLRQIFGEQVRERRRLADGYAFRFDADTFDEIARFAANERRCCPFLAFTLELAPNEGPIWLRLTGPAGTHAFLDAEIPKSPGIAA